MPKDECSTCEVYKEWSGVEANLKNLMDFETRMITNNGALERIWTAIDSKVSKGMITAMAIIIMAFVGTLFGLVYHSNHKILTEFAELKASVIVIQKSIEKNGG